MNKSVYIVLNNMLVFCECYMEGAANGTNLSSSILNHCQDITLKVLRTCEEGDLG
jgi:hypothetical protein